jgi:hypothetical protein
MAEFEGKRFPYEVIFRNVHKLLMDTATSEFYFCLDFFEDEAVFKDLFAPIIAVVEHDLVAAAQVQPAAPPLCCWLRCSGRWCVHAHAVVTHTHIAAYSAGLGSTVECMSVQQLHPVLRGNTCLHAAKTSRPPPDPVRQFGSGTPPCWRHAGGASCMAASVCWEGADGTRCCPRTFHKGRGPPGLTMQCVVGPRRSQAPVLHHLHCCHHPPDAVMGSSHITWCRN